MLTEVIGGRRETAYVTDNPFLVGPRYVDFRRTLDIARPDFSQGSYRAFNTPVQPAGAAQRDRALPAPDAVGHGRGPPPAELRRLEQPLPRRESDYSAARVMRSGMDALDELKDKQPFFLGVDAFDPHEPFDAPRVYSRTLRARRRAPRSRGSCRSSRGHS